MLFTGLFFMPLLDGGIHLGGIRIILFNIYCAVLFPVAFFALLHRPASVRIGIMWFWLSLLVVSWALSSMRAMNIDLALLEVMRNIQLMIFAFILVMTVRSVDDLRFLMTGMLWAVAWNSVIGWIQSIFGNDVFTIRKFHQINAQHYLGTPGIYGDRTITSFNDPIMSGYFLAVGLCMALGWALSTTSRRERFWTYVLVVLAAVPLITSASRGPILGCLVTGSVLLFFSGKVAKRLAFLVALTAMFLVFLPEDIIKSQWTDWDSIFYVVADRSAMILESKRWLYWYHILGWSQKTPLGVGLGNFADAAPAFIPYFFLYIRVLDGFYINAHAESMYFTQLIEVGWLGFVAFCGLVAFALKKSWNVYRYTVGLTSRYESGIFAGLFGAWLCSAICMIPVYGYNNTGIAVLFWALLGFAMSLDLDSLGLRGEV